jgi:diguanylate cyclase (GGDEF)-like protein
VTAGTAPVVTAAIWASGGASSFLQPLLLFTALFILLLLPAAPRVAADGPVRGRVLDAAAVRRGRARRELPGARCPLHGRAAGATVVMQILFDFDEFKAVNDLHGHPVGDAVLVAVASACAGVVREGDSLARLGGDEFAVIAPSAGSAGVARIVAALEEVIAGADLPPQVPDIAASFAWAVAPHDADSASELLDCADQRLLYRKRLNKTTI